MKQIRIGITNDASLLHKQICFKSEEILSATAKQNNFKKIFRSGDEFIAESINDSIVINGQKTNCAQLLIEGNSANTKIGVGFNKQFITRNNYVGQLIVIAEQNKLRLVLNYPLEEYVQSVLQGEMPANFHFEALKAQAICARTYALHPRVNHHNDFCDVCDSYLCCQCFSTIKSTNTNAYLRAASETSGEILTYNEKPILALFSSCAGGHTENYEDCFSDWETNKFPPSPIPYLKGISESSLVTNQSVDEIGLRSLWHSQITNTFDSWSKKFRWSYKLSNDYLQSEIHNTIASLLHQEQFAPFVIPPSSGIVGHIKSFTITKRGVGGTAIHLEMDTTKGKWQFTKELTIRSLLKNQSIKRLPSAKIFFDTTLDSNQELISTTVHGLGSGHGVGLQQIGAEGQARLNKSYKEILYHYYRGALIDKI